MTIFRYSFLSLIALWQTVHATTPSPLPEIPEIVRIVAQPDDIAAQTEAKAWIERNRHDMADMGRKLAAAGFKQEDEGRPYPGCGSFTYAGKRDATGKDIIASFVVCPGRPPLALVITLLPVDKHPQGPLPLITPPVTTEGK